MELSNDIGSSTNRKVKALQLCLQQSLENFNELVIEIERLRIESENNKTHISTQKEIERKSCSNCETLNRVLTKKETIMQQIASKLTILSKTKNLNILNEVFTVLYEGSITMTPPTENKDSVVLVEKPPIEYSLITPKKEEPSVLPKVLKDESISEIEGTPTGRTSPIIQSKKTSSFTNMLDSKEKKKCPSNWRTPEKKTLKLTPTPSQGKSKGKLRQSRLKLLTVKPTDSVDLTRSPETIRFVEAAKENTCKELINIKKESMEIEDTILPSPTSRPMNISLIHKSTIKSSLNKFTTPSSPVVKTENVIKIEKNGNNFIKSELNCSDVDESINILKEYNRLAGSPKKSPSNVKKIDEGITYCELIENTPVLQNVSQYEPDQRSSTKKRHLAENINFANVPSHEEYGLRELLLRPDKNLLSANNENVKRKTPEKVEPVYKEPTVRKKAEKRALPGWSCDECRLFYDELYKYDPEMLAKKMNECSRHRGQNNPIRPKTPPGFWYPRWDVPENTEEFNKRNNAD